jgi:hypothetical protein
VRSKLFLPCVYPQSLPQTAFANMIALAFIEVMLWRPGEEYLEGDFAVGIC